MTNHLSTVLRDFRLSGGAGTIRRPAGEPVTRGDGWLMLALGLATLIAAIDAAASNQFIIIGLLVAPPIISSATVGSRATALVAGYCLLLALLALVWHNWSADNYLPRLLIILSAGLLSVWNASLRERVIASARGGALMAEGLSMLDNALEEQALVEELAKVPVPELADLAVVDLTAPDDTIGAVAVETLDTGVAQRIRRYRRTRRLLPHDDHPIAEVIRTGERKLYEDMGDGAMRELALDAEHLDLIHELRPRSTLIVPLSAGTAPIGTLMLVSFENDHRFGSEEIGFAEELARRAAAGIRNARLHDEQARLADALQQALLPRALPSVQGLEIAARFRPVGVDAKIGGDFYDLFRLDESSWAAVIGDVCGKGPEAAALTSLMRDTLRASALRGEGPAETLALLNAAILEAGADGRFCTATYARFDLAAKASEARLTVCNGGHPPPLVLRKGGAVEPVGEPGTLLGIYEDPSLVDTQVPLSRGDLVTLYTDGLYDVRPSSRLPTEPLEEVLATCKGMSAEETAGAIEKSVLDSERGAQQDDRAILVVRRS